MRRWLIRQYYKLWHHDGLMWVQHMNGKFKVRYPDGAVSMPMSWRTANDYRDMFGGEVIDNF